MDAAKVHPVCDVIKCFVRVSALIKHLIARYAVGESDQLSRASSLFTDALASPKNILALSL